MRCLFSVVRFVPNAASGEFVNVGAIAGCEESSEWQVRQVSNPTRARAILGRNDNSLESAWLFIEQVGRTIHEHEEPCETLWREQTPRLDENWLHELHRCHRNLVQLSPPAPMVADSVDDALDAIFELMVVDPAQRRFGFRKKTEAVAAMRKAYLRKFIRKGANLREVVHISTGKFTNQFDFCVTNGEVLQLAHAWSFQVPDQEAVARDVRAWGWTVRDIRDNGAEARASDFAMNVPKDVDVQVVYVSPEDHRSSPAMDEALHVFDKLQVPHHELSDTDGVAGRARQLLIQAGVQLDMT